MNGIAFSSVFKIRMAGKYFLKCLIKVVVYCIDKTMLVNPKTLPNLSGDTCTDKLAVTGMNDAARHNSARTPSDTDFPRCSAWDAIADRVSRRPQRLSAPAGPLPRLASHQPGRVLLLTGVTTQGTLAARGAIAGAREGALHV